MSVATTQSLDLRTLVDRYGGRINALALRLCGNRADAEDAVQETFLRAFRKREQFEGRSDPGTWLYTIATRVCLRLRRKRGSKSRAPVSLDSLSPAGAGMLADPDSLRGPEGAALHKESLGAIGRAITRLPNEYRLPLVLKDIAELSVDESARVLGLKSGTVKIRLHRARLMLRKALDKALPTRLVPGVAYEKQVCMDLLAAKQAALDRGEAFPLNTVMCERCRVIFSSLDITVGLCREFTAAHLPLPLRTQVLSSLETVRRPVSRGRPRRTRAPSR
jgi:RNA polymerase sigma-70 factor (ECF subfamily)